jgi:hypothetical protein
MLSTTLEATCRMNTESAYGQFRAASRVQVPFRDRENRSSEVIPLGKDTKSRRSEDCARTPGIIARSVLSVAIIHCRHPDLAPLIDYIRSHDTEPLDGK